MISVCHATWYKTDGSNVFAFLYKYDRLLGTPWNG